MTTEQWQKVKEVYDELAGREPSERLARLDVGCPEDAAVRAEVEILLGLRCEVGEFLEHPPQLAFGPDQSGKQIGAYRLLGEIGRGGMGTVYLAERTDDVHRKPVAIKLVWPGFDSAEIFKRFRQERHILAELNHPNIAGLLDGGTTDEGWPYVVMEYVAGEPITQHCNQRRLSVTERLKLFQQVCAAVGYAHHARVIHRDLKPSNILVTRDGTAKLLDFGIAKILDPALRPDSLSLTNTGLQAMTPEYASPEQVRGHNITVATDVYSLGVMLYELLTGHQPYRFEKRVLHEVMRVITEQEPLRPSHVNNIGSVPRAVASGSAPEIANPVATAPGTEPMSNAQETTPDKLRRRLEGDLDNIILKALRKEPEQRYASVEQFSEDITRHLSGKPVLAQAPTLVYLSGKFVRRNKIIVAFAAFVAMALIAAVIFAGRQWRADRARAREDLHAQYAARMNQAVQERENFNVEGIRETVESFLPQPSEEDLRGFEWRYLWRWHNRNLLTLPHNDPNKDGTGVYFTKDGTVAITMGNGNRDGIFKVWNAETGKLFSELPRGPNLPRSVLCWDEAGNVVQETEKQSFKIWQPDTGKEIASVNHGLSPITRCNLDMSDPQRRLFTASEDGTIAAWELATGKLLFSFKTDAPITFLYTAPKRKRFIISVGHKRLELWDMATRRLISSFDDRVLFRSNSQDETFGSFILSPAGTGVAIWHDWLTGRELRRVEFDPSSGNQFFFGGRRLFSYGTSTNVLVRDFLTGHRIAELSGHKEWIHSLAVNPQETIAATAGADRTVRLWDLQTYKQLAVIPAHDREVMSVHFSHDGRKLITGSQDRTAKIWDVASLLVPDKLEGHTDHILSVAFSPDSRKLATAGRDRTVKLWDAETGKLLHTMHGHQHDIFTVAFSPSGDRIATGSEDLTVRIWDTATGKQIRELNGFTRRLRAVAFSPDGKLLAIGCDYRDKLVGVDDRLIRILDATTYRELAIFKGHTDEVVSLDFSPDGKTLASGSWDGTVKLWEVATGRELATLRGHTDRVWSVRFSPDGQRLASGSTDHSVKLWDVKTTRELWTMKTHSNEVFSVAFSPDGRRLASASNDHTIKLWDATTGRELVTFRDHTDQVFSVAFSPDGRTLASGSFDKTVRLYRAATEQDVRKRLATDLRKP